MDKSRLIGATMVAAHERRRSDRLAPDASIGPAARAPDAIPIAVTNISRHGFAAITDRTTEEGAEIVFEAAGVRREARVVWQNGVTIGAEFLLPLSEAELSSILSGSASAI